MTLRLRHDPRYLPAPFSVVRQLPDRMVHFVAYGRDRDEALTRARALYPTDTITEETAPCRTSRRT